MNKPIVGLEVDKTAFRYFEPLKRLEAIQRIADIAHNEANIKADQAYEDALILASSARPSASSAQRTSHIPPPPRTSHNK